jgi:hypothetical protein
MLWFQRKPSGLSQFANVSIGSHGAPRSYGRMKRQGPVAPNILFADIRERARSAHPEAAHQNSPGGSAHQAYPVMICYGCALPIVNTQIYKGSAPRLASAIEEAAAQQQGLS